MADLAGLPPAAGGVFVAGGSAGNLSALVAARDVWRRHRLAARAAAWRHRGQPPAPTPRSSAARVMDADAIGVPVDPGRLTGDAGGAVLDDSYRRSRARRRRGRHRRAPPTPGSSTTSPGRGRSAAERGHLVPRRRRLRRRRPGRALGRHRFDGIERADSGDRPAQVAVRPGRLRRPALPATPRSARAAHTQHASYLDMLTEAPGVEPVRLRLPPHPPGPGPAVLVLARTHGTGPTPRPSSTLQLTQAAGELVQAMPPPRAGARARALHGAVPPPRLGSDDYGRWSEQALADGLTFTCRPRGTARPSCASAS